MWYTWIYVCLTLTLAACKPCDKGWHFYKGKCYYKNSSKLTWHQSEVECMSHGSHLVNPDNQDVKDHIVSLLQEDDSIWVRTDSNHLKLSDEFILGKYCTKLTRNLNFVPYDFYDTIFTLIDDPEDADGYFTFFFDTDFESGARERCEDLCRQNSRCAAYTYYAFSDVSRPHWWGTCIGRSDDYNILVPYSYGFSGVRPMPKGSLINESCLGKYGFVCEKSVLH